MVVIMKEDATEAQVAQILFKIEALGCQGASFERNGPYLRWRHRGHQQAQRHGYL